MNPIYEKLEKCYQCVREKTDFVPEVAIILGSGFGQFADEFEEVKKISYHEIEGFPVSTVQGHAGEFIFGYMQDVPVVLMNGRVHYYEGYVMSDVVLPTRLMKMLGAKILFLTNAAGGLGDGFAAWRHYDDHRSAYNVCGFSADRSKCRRIRSPFPGYV